MTVRDLFNSIGVWLEHTFTQTVIPYIREVLEVLLFQKNWLDASLVSVISVIVVYGWVLGSLYNFITETLEHKKRYREDADYREEFDELARDKAMWEENRIENEKKELAEAPFYKRHQFLLFFLGWLILVIAVFSILTLDGI